MNADDLNFVLDLESDAADGDAPEISTFHADHVTRNVLNADHVTFVKVIVDAFLLIEIDFYLTGVLLYWELKCAKVTVVSRV